MLVAVAKLLALGVIVLDGVGELDTGEADALGDAGVLDADADGRALCEPDADAVDGSPASVPTSLDESARA